MSETRARLMCRTGKLAGATYELGADSTIGRDRSNDIVLLAETVSGRHARIYRRDGAYFLEDVGSSNGTQVDGLAVTDPVQLDTLNVITFSGSFDVIFQVVGSAAVTPPPSVSAPSGTPSPTSHAQPLSGRATPPVPSQSASPPSPDPEPVRPKPTPLPQPHAPTGDHTRVDLEAFAPLPVLKDVAQGAPAGAPAPPAYHLVVQILELPPIELPLKPGRNTIGRSDDCDATIRHESLSRKHASISVTAEGLVLEDLGSTNGTHVDGIEVKKIALSENATFKLGTEVRVRVETR